MVPGSVPGNKPGESDLTTSSAEQRTRTFDVVPADRAEVSGPAPGDVLKNRFVLHQCLADGSASRLFRALDRRRESAGDPDPWVVLKVVTAPKGPGSGEREPRALQALRREAAIAQGFEHPNLPRIIGIDHDGPYTFVCMAWLEGESLAAILDSRGTRPMTRVQALPIIEGVGRALIHLHAQGITHADVKPGNILVTARGNATLLDFGVALGPGAGDLPAARGFTPEYASPEVLAGNEPTPSDDLFSLACVAYRMLDGHRAFGTTTAREAAATGYRPSPPPHLSPAQWRALDRALSFARAERQPDVATFLAQLKGARDESVAIADEPATDSGLPLAAGTDSGPVTSGPRAVLRPAAILLAVALAVTASLLWVRPAPDPAPTPAAAPVDPPQEEPVTSGPLPVPVAEDAVAPPVGELPSSPSAGAAPAATSPPGERAATPAPSLPETPATGLRAAGTASEWQADTPAPPVELAGPPVPDPVADASPVPAPVAAAAQPGAAPADNAGTGRTVPFSRLTVRHYVQPDYPRNAAARRVPGWVDVAFTVEPAGRTRDVRVVGADPPGVFDEAALAAVRRWRFAVTEDADGTDAPAGPVHSEIRVRFDPR